MVVSHLLYNIYTIYKGFSTGPKGVSTTAKQLVPAVGVSTGPLGFKPFIHREKATAALKQGPSVNMRQQPLGKNSFTKRAFKRCTPAKVI